MILFKHRKSSFIVVIKYLSTVIRQLHVYMLFAGWEVRIVKNCDRDLENAAPAQAEVSIFKSEVTVFHYTDRP